LRYARRYLWPVCEARAITSINRAAASRHQSKGLLVAVADALAEHDVELHDMVGPGRGDLVSGTIAVLGRDRQLRELGPLA
jgi:hypothetical protein